MFLLLLLTLTSQEVEAHGFLERSDPEANSVVAEVPESVHLWFTEPPEGEFSKAELFDAHGQRIETDKSFVGPAPNQITLPLPADLPNGTYSVQWRNVSTADGHPEMGYVPFTVGSGSDIVIPIPPAQVSFGGPPAEVNAVGRWLSLLGMAGAAGAIATWFWVIKPARQTLARPQRAAVARNVRLVALLGVVVAVVGSLVMLAVQASAAGSAFSISGMVSVVSDTRFGTLWLIRMALLLMLGAFLYMPYTWSDDKSPLRWIGFGLVVAAMLPFSLNSHGAAPGEGRAAAVVVDWIHLAASSVWMGGLLAVLAGVIYGVRGAPGETRRQAYALIIPRFSTLAIASVILLAITGFYSSWLQVGNLVALRETSYGQTLSIKVGLTLLMVVLGSINLLVIGPRLRRAATSSAHFGRTIAAEVVLGVLVLFLVGLLTSLPTARETINAESGRTVFHLQDDGIHISLYVSPGAVGANRYTADVDVPANELPEGTEILLRTTPSTDLQGVRETTLVQTESGRFETSGTELSVVGEWQLELIFRRPGKNDWRAVTETTISAIPPEVRAPGPAPRFLGVDGVLWVLALGGSVLSLVVGMRRGTGRGLAGLGAILACMSIGGLVLASESPTENPIPVTEESIATGQALFQENCVACHGPGARGGGSLLEGVDAANADLTAAHVLDHPDGELYRWIREGIGGTMMPGFGDELSDEEIWHLVNYILSLQGTAGGS